MDIVEKTRRLKKCEASEAVAFRFEASPGMDFFSPFGLLIGRTRISVDLIDHLNAVSDAVLTPGQGAEFELSEADCFRGGEDSLQSCVTRAIRTYVESVEHEPSGLVQLDNPSCTTVDDQILRVQKPLNHRRRVGGGAINRR